MSWFDSSFSFAKTALSQAQRSIDKVLDIKEDADPLKTSSDPSVVHSTPSPVEASSNNSLSETTSLKKPRTPKNPSRVDKPDTPSGAFDSTWGMSDSVWGTPLSSLSPSTGSSHPKDSRRSKITSSNSPEKSISRSKSKSKPTDHMTSTPVVGEGAMTREKDVQGLTPVKPSNEQTTIPVSEDAGPSIVETKSDQNIQPNSTELSSQASPMDKVDASSQQGSNLSSDTDQTAALVPPSEAQPAIQSNNSKEVCDTVTPIPSEKVTDNEQSPRKQDTITPHTIEQSSSQENNQEANFTDSPTSIEVVDGVPLQGETTAGSEQRDRGGTEQHNDGIVSNEAMEALKKEVSRLRELLEARESKLMIVSQQMASLTDENNTLQSQLAEAREAGLTDLEEMRSEFTRRIGTADKKLQAVSKERDSLRKQLQALQNEQSQQKKTQDNSSTKLLQEKDEQIAQLMEEGEKLSKQELQSNSTIKKLRQKERQNDQLLSSQKQHIEDVEAKVSSLKDQIKKKDENERKYQESLGQLNAMVEQQARELTILKTERDGLSDKVRSLQTNLDNAYKELSEVQKENAVSQTAAQEATITAQSIAREEVKELLEIQKTEAQKEKDALLLQLDELRLSMTRAEQLSARKEDHLRQEISDLQERLQEAETRNQELTSSISQATKPLLRQIENIQVAHSTQAANWEKVESNLMQRLATLQAQSTQSSEKERAAVEKEMTLQSRMTILETQASSLRQEKSQLLASEELLKAKLQTIEEEQHRDSVKMDALRSTFQQTVEDLRKEKEMLGRQLEYERVRLEAESKKARLESQEKERLKLQVANLSTLHHPPAAARQSSSGSIHSQSELLELSLGRISESSYSGETTEMVDHHSYSLKGGSASVIEHLQSLLKQKEGELSTSQTLVGTLERSRSALAEELSSLLAENESLKTQTEQIAPLRENLQRVERQHEAMLQMYGEKAEEAEELKLDILDMKAMYRQQIDELLSGKR